LVGPQLQYKILKNKLIFITALLFDKSSKLSEDFEKPPLNFDMNPPHTFPEVASASSFTRVILPISPFAL
jgi:hypothetical protein